MKKPTINNYRNWLLQHYKLNQEKKCVEGVRYFQTLLEALEIYIKNL